MLLSRTSVPVMHGTIFDDRYVRRVGGSPQSDLPVILANFDQIWPSISVASRPYLGHTSVSTSDLGVTEMKITSKLLWPTSKF